MSNWPGKKIQYFIDNFFKDLQKNNKLIFLYAYKIVHVPLYEVVAFLLAHLDYVQALVPLLLQSMQDRSMDCWMRWDLSGKET